MLRTAFCSVVIVAALAGAGLSCRSTSPPATAGTPPATSSSSPPAAPEGSQSLRYEGPKVSLVVRTVDGATQATATVTFRTGGWDLREDRTRVVNGVGIANLTFVGPGRDEMVTQAIARKDWSWRSERPFTRAEVWVDVVRRGEPARKPEYRLAARHP